MTTSSRRTGPTYSWAPNGDGRADTPPGRRPRADVGWALRTLRARPPVPRLGEPAGRVPGTEDDRVPEAEGRDVPRAAGDAQRIRLGRRRRVGPVVVVDRWPGERQGVARHAAVDAVADQVERCPPGAADQHIPAADTGVRVRQAGVERLHAVADVPAVELHLADVRPAVVVLVVGAVGDAVAVGVAVERVGIGERAQAVAGLDVVRCGAVRL